MWGFIIEMGSYEVIFDSMGLLPGNTTTTNNNNLKKSFAQALRREKKSLSRSFSPQVL